ncbi:hypothetical protein PGB90_006239 [Kerria lacca]
MENVKRHRKKENVFPDVVIPFKDFATAVRLKLDDVKTRGKKISSSEEDNEKHTSHKMTKSKETKKHFSKTRSEQIDPRTEVKTQSSTIKMTSNKPQPKLSKMADYKNPIVKELTKTLTTEARKPTRRRNSVAIIPKPKSRPRKNDGIFQKGRQRPSGPVRTFIVFKATSKRKPARSQDKRYQIVPYDQKLFEKSKLMRTEVKHLKKKKMNIDFKHGNKIHVGTVHTPLCKKNDSKLKIEKKLKSIFDKEMKKSKAKRRKRTTGKTRHTRVNVLQKRPVVRKRRRGPALSTTNEFSKKNPFVTKSSGLMLSRKTLARGLRPDADNTLRSRLIHVRARRKLFDKRF